MAPPYLKLCGLHSEEDVITANHSRADYVGFVMAESKRKVHPNEAASWLDRHKLPGKKVAALFVNAPLHEIRSSAAVLHPDIIQLHGAESPEEAGEVKEVTGTIVWKALPHDEYTLDKMKKYLPFVDGFVIDAKVKGAWGGTGKSFDWGHVPRYVQFGKDERIPVLIAGGITPANIENLLSYHPWGIDLSSGIEQNGKKDKHLIHELEKRLNDD
ncbi:phosphoribosylanthranilate isomerase [Bacillus piscicola]|uniref:phosphoribosylanthranilate isomerase n=1 Tax=Bacillus piscicola TaxID=1632684 RepID=UPI001F09337F|nr:phosphoribosylanthranilate isomerase [Bacillus piscicola]